MEKATFAGGCFWCTEAIFQRLKGVTRIISGYMGGHAPHPSYEQVSSGETGHAECNQIEFDPKIISYSTLLDIFFNLHDPTTLNRQGADVGTQYRSAIFFYTSKQQELATLAKSQIPKAITEIVPATEFFPAETIHQNYFDNHTNAPYCSIVISPKIKRLYEKYQAFLTNPS